MTKQEAIKILDKYDLNFCDIDGNPIPPQDLAEAFDMAIQALEQEPKHGYWLEAKEEDPCWYRCSECGRLYDLDENYCPNCGARMEEEQ